MVIVMNFATSPRLAQEDDRRGAGFVNGHVRATGRLREHGHHRADVGGTDAVVALLPDELVHRRSARAEHLGLLGRATP